MTRKRNTLTTIDDATPTRRQHKSPCKDCPFARTALPGWLGGSTPEDYLALAHQETIIDCHTRKGDGIQCAGVAIYRANVLKRCRSTEILVLPKDRDQVFATPMEFLEHHRGVTT